MNLKNYIARAKSNSFLRNVAILSSGTIISQIIVIAASPFLTRLFPVESFGILQLFTSYMVISAVISTGRYELAMGLPSKDEDARKLFQLIVFLGAAVSLFYLFIIFISKEILHLQENLEILKYWWVYLAPLYIFFIALYSGLIYWLQRKKNYKKITVANAVQVVLTAIFGVVFGFLRIESGLILALIFSIIIATFFLLYSYVKENQLFTFSEIKTIGKEYISFPKHMIISDLSLTTSQQFIPILFSFLFSTTIVGFFSMANRMLRLPNIVITSSIANVFRNDAIDEIRISGNCKQLYVATFKKLLFLSIPIYFIVFILAPTLFQVVFGEEWLEAGYYARIIALFLFIEFVATPLNTMFYVREKQKLLMRLQILNAILGAVAIYLGAVFFDSARMSLVFYTVNAIVLNIIMLIFSFKISKNEI